MASEAKSLDKSMRDGEAGVPLPDDYDASVYFIGRIETPWKTRADCPKRGDVDGPDCTITVDARWAAALQGLEAYDEIAVLYWMDQARRDLVVQAPRHHQTSVGTFALRSPVRPNPIALSRVRLVGIDGQRLQVRGLDCIDGTPLIDIKPEFTNGRRRCDEDVQAR
jgi:tRNA (adenine37-N6)-methyltransferase